MAYTLEDKLYTDDPMLDELVHNVKLMIQGIILKDQEEANNSETLESIEQSDIYVAIKSGNQGFSTFRYTEDILRMLNVFTQEEINNYIIDYELIPVEYRDQLISLASDLFLTSYVEQNNYYRNLNGKPNYGTQGLYVDSSYIPDEYLPYFDLKITIDNYTTNQINILDKLGILAKFQEEYPELNYLYHLGPKAIDVFTARKAAPFSLLYINRSVEDIVLTRFKDIIESNRVIYLKRHYSTAYKFTSDYYEKFMIIMIIAQSVSDLLVEMPEWYIRRDVFDVRTCEFILESNGVRFFKQIPLKFQITLVRNLNQIIKYKSCNKNIYDISELFGLKDVVVYKYFLLKQRKLDINGRYVKADQDQEVIKDANGRYAKNEKLYLDYDGRYAEELIAIEEEINGLDASLDSSTKEDLDEMFELLFVRTPIEDLFDNNSRNNINNLKYDAVTLEDPYWDGENDHEYVRQQILEKDFTVEATKYLSVEAISSAKEYIFQLEYFLNILFNNNTDKSTLDLQVPIINSDSSFNLVDLFILLYILTFNYYNPETPDIIKNTNRYNPIPIPEPIITYLGDYDPDNLKDYVCDGRYAYTESDYYMADGILGYIDEEEQTWINTNGMDSANSVALTDYPLADVYERVEGFKTDYDGLYADEYPGAIFNGGNAGVSTFGSMFYDGGDSNNTYIYKYKDPRWENYNGRFVVVEGERLDVDGGESKKSKYKYLNNQGGHSSRSTVDYDYPEADESILNIETADLEVEGLGAFSFVEYLDLDGIDGNDYNNSDYYVMDGGHAVNSYINSYFDLDPDIYEDPCLYYEEWNDNSRKDFTYIDTYDRLFGFNLYADMEWLSNKVESHLHPKFSYLRGYTLEELGVDKFMTPSDAQFADVEELLNLYEHNKKIYDVFTQEMLNVENQDDYYVYEFVYKYLFTMEWKQDYFIKTNGEMAIYYSEFLKDKDFMLYSFYTDIMSETDIETRKYIMNEKMDLIINSMETYLEYPALNHIFDFAPVRSQNLIMKWALLLINFFKSYKVTMLENGNTILFDDAVTNKVQINDKIAYSNIGYEKADTLNSREEMELCIEHEINIYPAIDDRLYFYDEYLEVFDLNGGRGSEGVPERFSLDGCLYDNITPFDDALYSMHAFSDMNGDKSVTLIDDNEDELEGVDLSIIDGGTASFSNRLEVNAGIAAVIVVDYDLAAGTAS